MNPIELEIDETKWDLFTWIIEIDEIKLDLFTWKLEINGPLTNDIYGTYTDAEMKEFCDNKIL
jgi:hypothetical protein